MKRKLLVTGAVLLVIALLVIWFASASALLPSRESTIFRRVGMDPKWAHHTLLHAYWSDWLQYTDGYEVLVAKGQPGVAPDGINWTPDLISMEDIESKSPRAFSAEAKKRLEAILLPEAFDAYHMVFEDKHQELWVLLYHHSGMLLIYRGHHLYGL